MAIIAVPVSKLVLSEQYQARRTRGPMSLETLAASIHAHGLIHNLTAVKAKKRGYYEVVAGGRRLQAIQLLVADGRWSASAQKISASVKTRFKMSRRTKSKFTKGSTLHSLVRSISTS